MVRVYFFGIFLVFFGFSVNGERVLSRERSFVAPSLVVRKEIKREDIANIKIPVSSPRLISLDSNINGNVIITRPTDFVYINSSDLKFAHNSYYSVNGAPFFISLGAIQLPKPGSYQLTYYSIDFFGNRESSKTRILIVDSEPPKLSVHFSPVLPMAEDKQICSPTASIVIQGTDTLSGLKTIYWKKSNEESWIRYETPIPISVNRTDDSFMIHSYAVDKAGNVSQVETIGCYNAQETGK